MNRREFVKRTTLSAAVIAVAPAIIPQAAEAAAEKTITISEWSIGVDRLAGIAKVTRNGTLIRRFEVTPAELVGDDETIGVMLELAKRAASYMDLGIVPINYEAA